MATQGPVADKYHLHQLAASLLFEPVTTEPAHLLEIDRATGAFSLKTRNTPKRFFFSLYLKQPCLELIFHSLFCPTMLHFIFLSNGN